MYNIDMMTGCNNPRPIIHTRIPLSLQQVFIKSNRGQAVHVPPRSADVSICRNWHDMASSKRHTRKYGAKIQICEEKSTDSVQKVTSFEISDGMVDCTTVSDISESECDWSDDYSSIDSADMDFLEKLISMEIAPSNRWEAGDRDVSPQKRFVRKHSEPNIQQLTNPTNRWVDGVKNVSAVKHQLPPRTKSPDSRAERTDKGTNFAPKPIF